MSADNIKTLSYSLDGSIWCRVTAKSTVIADTLEYSLDGSPWWGVAPASGTTTTTTTGLFQWLIYVGAVRISAIYLGATEVTTAYLGSSELIE